MDFFTPALFRAMFKQQTIVIILGTTCGASLWDWVNCLPAEIKHIFIPEGKALWQKRRMPTIPSMLLLASRFLTIPYISVVFYAVLGLPDDCKGTWRMTFVFYAIASGIAVGTLIVRTVAIRGSGWPMTTFLCILLVTQTTAWSIMISQITFVQVPRFSQYQNVCVNVNIPQWTWIMIIALACFEILLFTLSIEKQIRGSSPEDLQRVWKMWQKLDYSPAKQFYKDKIFYYAINITVTIFEVIWFYFHRTDALFSLIGSGFHIWFVCCIVPRAVRNLKLGFKKRERAMVTMRQTEAWLRRTNGPDPSSSSSSSTYKQNGIPFNVQVHTTKSLPDPHSHPRIKFAAPAAPAAPRPPAKPLPALPTNTISEIMMLEAFESTKRSQPVPWSYDSTAEPVLRSHPYRILDTRPRPGNEHTRDRS